jgi:hypothetical protein
MTLAVSGYGNTAHSAAQPLRLWFGLPVAIRQASKEQAVADTAYVGGPCKRCGKLTSGADT